jgi:hypothetical protein
MRRPTGCWIVRGGEDGSCPSRCEGRVARDKTRNRGIVARKSDFVPDPNSTAQGSRKRGLASLQIPSWPPKGT